MTQIERILKYHKKVHVIQCYTKVVAEAHFFLIESLKKISFFTVK